MDFYTPISKNKKYRNEKKFVSIENKYSITLSSRITNELISNNNLLNFILSEPYNENYLEYLLENTNVKPEKFCVKTIIEAQNIICDIFDKYIKMNIIKMIFIAGSFGTSQQDKIKQSDIDIIILFNNINNIITFDEFNSGITHKQKHSIIYDELKEKLGREIDLVWFLIGKNKTNCRESVRDENFEENCVGDLRNGRAQIIYPYEYNITLVESIIDDFIMNREKIAGPKKIIL